jgi:hypothetical protein
VNVENLEDLPKRPGVLSDEDGLANKAIDAFIINDPADRLSGLPMLEPPRHQRLDGQIVEGGLERSQERPGKNVILPAKAPQDIL